MLAESSLVDKFVISLQLADKPTTCEQDLICEQERNLRTRTWLANKDRTCGQDIDLRTTCNLRTKLRLADKTRFADKRELRTNRNLRTSYKLRTYLDLRTCYNLRTNYNKPTCEESVTKPSQVPDGTEIETQLADRTSASRTCGPIVSRKTWIYRHAKRETFYSLM